jgi:ATP-dependent protease ClpP protease subunit
LRSVEVAVAKSHLSWRVLNASADEADIDIFDMIGDPWEGTTAQDFVKELRAIKASRINLHINSPGGYVSDGLAMYAAIRSHKAEIVAYVESEAASAASFVAMAADKVAIFPQAKIFIHDAHGFAIGNAKDMRTLAEMLEEESNNIASIYAEKAGGTKEKWREAMQANEGVGSTYRGKEAVSAGLADEVVSTARNYDPARIAAYIAPADPPPPPSEITLPADLGAQFQESASYSPPPTLEELFTKQAAKERISVGVGATGGK